MKLLFLSSFCLNIDDNSRVKKLSASGFCEFSNSRRIREVDENGKFTLLTQLFIHNGTATCKSHDDPSAYILKIVQQ